MSTKSYSTDLRIRVINYIKAGNSQRGASKLFSVSKSAVNRWWGRYEQEKSFSAKPKLGSKSKISSEEIEAFVEKNPSKTSIEIGLNFGLSKSAIQKRLQKLGFRYKKKRLPMWKQMKKSDPCI